MKVTKKELNKLPEIFSILYEALIGEGQIADGWRYEIVSEENGYQYKTITVDVFEPRKHKPTAHVYNIEIDMFRKVVNMQNMMSFCY